MNAASRMITILSLVACHSGRGTAPTAPVAETSSRLGVHGMVLFGDGPLFLSHIPMFRAPHDVQLVLEVQVPSPPSELPTAFSSELYTVEPEPFSLDAVRDGSRTRFLGTVFRGNFEHGGTPIVDDVSFEVVRIVHDRVLDAAAATPAVPEYLALGGGPEVVLVHLLDGAPGFDHIVAAQFGGPPSSLSGGLRVPFPGASNTPEGRIAAGVQVDLGSAASVTVIRELSCLVGPDFTELCP